MPYAIAPAETRLPFSALVRGILPGQADFAATLAKHLGVDNCFLADSARSLLFIALKAIHQSAPAEQNEVLIPGYTCYSVPAAIVKAGLKVSLYDLDPYSFQPDMADVEKKITPRTLALIGQHLLGIPSDIGGLSALARKNHIWCIEDAAQRMDFQRTGSINESAPDVTLYSFGRGKPLPLGHGGALVIRRKMDMVVPPGANGQKTITPMAVRLLSWPGFYWLLEKLPLGLGQTIYRPCFKVQAMNPGYQRIGCIAADHFDRLNRHRSRIATIYSKALGSDKDLTAFVPACLRYPMLTEDQQKMSKLAQYGVRRLYPKALCDLKPLIPDLTVSGIQTPGSKQIARQLVTLPTHQGIKKQLALRIADHAAKMFGDVLLVV